MSDPSDPIDEAATARPRAGMVWKDRRQLPGLALTVVAVLAFVAFMTATAVGDAGWATGLGILALIAAVTGVGWILIGRTRTAERRQKARGGNHRQR